MNILIVGAGYVGTYLHNHLKKEHACVLFARKNLDYAKHHVVRDYMIENQIECVINASGYTGKPNVDACETDKKTCWVNNVVIPKTIETTCMSLSAQYIHISSGCIYTGYEKEYTEHDEPNFGLYDNSSWYSKTKHACETILDLNYSTVLRIRMPFSSCTSNRNFIMKMLMYDNLVSYMNSMTCVEDLCVFMSNMFTTKKLFETSFVGLYNVVHEKPTCAHNIVHLLQKHGVNKKFSFTDIKKINMRAPRSNCILSDDKIRSLNMQLPDINTSLEAAISNVAKEYNKQDIW